MHKVHVEDRKEVCEDFKTIHQAKDGKAAKTALETFNKQIKKYTKRKDQFPNEESLERFLVT